MITLKNVMLVNSGSSGITGLALLLTAEQMSQLFAIHQTLPFVTVGIFLLAFAALIYRVVRKSPPNTVAVGFIILGDSLWVLGSAGIIMFQLFELSVIGYALIGAVALWVATMVYLQLTGFFHLVNSK